MMRIVLLLLGMAIGAAASWLWLKESITAERETSEASARPDDDAAESAPANSSAPAHVQLDASARSLADIATQAVEATRVAPEVHTPGRVLDGGELLAALRERRAAREAVHAQQALLASQRARLDRLRGFAARGEITVTRELNALEVAVRREADAVAARAAQLAQLQTTLRARWGAALINSDELETQLAEGKAQLVEFAAEQPPATVNIARDEQRATAQTATVLGAAPTALGSTGSATWVARVNDGNLRVAMRVSVWVPQGESQISGVLLPKSALVWHGGAPWYYVESASNVFERRRLDAAVDHELGMVVASGLEVGTQVVVRGAQALLAEELRQHIPSEDDD